MKKIILVSFVLMIGLLVCISSYAQNTTQQQPLKTAAGTVVNKDWVAGTLIVDTGASEMIFFIPHDVKITKGMHDSSLSEINVNDYVTIEYRDVRFVGLKAVNITIKSSES
jgi:hypothetical protein